MVVRTRRSTTLTTTTSDRQRQLVLPVVPAQNNVVQTSAENQGQDDVIDQKQEPSPPQQKEQHEQQAQHNNDGTTTSSSAASSITTHPVAIQQAPSNSTYHLLQHDRHHYPQSSTLKPSKLTTVINNNTIGRTESSQSNHNHNHNISSTTTNVHEEDDYYHFDPSPTYADVDDLPPYDVQGLNAVEPTGLGSSVSSVTSKMHTNTMMPTLEMGMLQQQQQQQQSLSQQQEPPPILDHSRPLLSHYHYNNEYNNNDPKKNNQTTGNTPSQSLLSNTPTRNGITCTVSFNVDRQQQQQQREKQQSKEQTNATTHFTGTNTTITTTSSNTGQSKVVPLKKQQRKRPPARETNNKQTKNSTKKKKLPTDSSSITIERITTVNDKQTRGSSTGANTEKKKNTQTAKNKASPKRKMASKAEANQVKEKATMHGKTPLSPAIATPFSENATTTTPTSSGGKNRLDRLWQERFEELVNYHQQHGHTRVPYNHDNVTLAKWVDRQRGQYKRFTKGLSSTLTTDRIEQLNSLEFVWSVRGPRSTVDWNVRYQQLLDYRNQHNGSCLVPYNYKENPSLGKWVEKQRSLYKSYMALSSSQGDKKGNSSGNKQVQINADRIRALDEIGFVWSRQTNWMDRYEQLKEYKTWHGDCLVPQSFEDKGLVKWIEKQRSQYKYFSNHQKSQLNPERVTLLNGIDFVWSLRQSSRFKRLEWDDRFVQLQQYEQHHGNCLVPYNYEINPTLAKWVEKQRNMYNRRMEGKTSQLTDERIQKLEQLGFIWSLRDRHCGGNRSATKSKRFYDNNDEKVEVQHNNMFHDPNEQLTTSHATHHCPSDSERTESSSNTQSYNASGIGDNKVGMSSEQESSDDIKDDSMLPPLGDSSPLSILPEATTCPLVVVSDIKNPTCSILSSPIKNRFDI